MGSLGLHCVCTIAQGVCSQMHLSYPFPLACSKPRKAGMKLPQVHLGHKKCLKCVSTSLLWRQRSWAQQCPWSYLIPAYLGLAYASESKWVGYVESSHPWRHWGCGIDMLLVCMGIGEEDGCNLLHFRQITYVPFVAGKVPVWPTAAQSLGAPSRERCGNGICFKFTWANLTSTFHFQL